jgi:hypothetical protein
LPDPGLAAQLMVDNKSGAAHRAAIFSLLMIGLKK